MKRRFFLFITLAIFSCKQADQTQSAQSKIDSLENKLAHTYKPSFGEFMSSVQVHHNKLWFAGQNENWKLADFEIHEIIEAIEGIQKYQAERKESQIIGMINPALDSVSNAIRKKDQALFKASYILLTNACNQCHKATEFEFNVVKIPDHPPFSNQDFKPQNEK